MCAERNIAGLREISSAFWAMDQRHLDRLIQALETTAPLGAVPRRLQAARQRRGSVAVLPVLGLITYRRSVLSDIFGGTVLSKWIHQFHDLVVDPKVGSIIVDVHSAGGLVDGVVETSHTIFEARRKKPIVAVANSFAGSAAYWLASSATKLFVLRSGEVGSIGVFVRHVDFSGANRLAGIDVTYIESDERKTETAPDKPLSDDAKTYLQSQVDARTRQFVVDVARNRGVSPATVRAEFGGGRTVLADEAVRRGMADRVIDSFSDAVAGAKSLAISRGIAQRSAELRSVELEALTGRPIEVLDAEIARRKAAARRAALKREEELARFVN